MNDPSSPDSLDPLPASDTPPVIVYLAGPDVFCPDAGIRATGQKALCRRFGLVPLHPLDQASDASAEIFRTNIAMIRRADAILANLDPFRGPEVDAGTAFEIGYATALRKPVIGYISRPESLMERVARLQGAIRFDAERSLWCDRDGLSIEDFGHPVNLMLAHACQAVVIGGLETAAAWFCTHHPGCGRLESRHFLGPDAPAGKNAP